MENGPIVVVTRDENLFVPQYLHELVRKHGEQIVMVWVDGVSSPHLGALDVTRLCGVAGIFRLAARLVHHKIFGALGLRKKSGRFYSLISMLNHHKIPYKFSFNVCSQQFIHELREIDPALLLSVANSRILPEDVLQVPRLCLNVHGSLLPRYRGILTAFWMLLNDEKEAGVTIHEMTAEVDSGSIYAQIPVTVNKGETIVSLYDKISCAGSKLIADTVGHLGSIDPCPMEEEQSNQRYSLPTREDMKRFLEEGGRFI